MSDYQATSELMLLCRKAGGPPVRVSEELFHILRHSQQLAEKSGGAFDVTMGPIVRLWRRARRTMVMPDPKRLAEASGLIGFRKLYLDARAQTVRLETSGMLLDLGGIAKGYAADEAIGVLTRCGITSALVAAGGDIVAAGAPPGTHGWTIAIAPLDAPTQAPRRHLLLRHAAVSTSGDAEQHVEIGGRRYSHIVDPRTGIGLTGRNSVTVVAPNGVASDGLATAVSVLGPVRGVKLIDATKGTAALMVQSTESGVRSFESKRWKRVPMSGRKVDGRIVWQVSESKVHFVLPN